MNKELVEKRIQSLEADLDKAIAQVNCIQGAIQDCYYWMEMLEKDDEKADDKKEASSEAVKQ